MDPTVIVGDHADAVVDLAERAGAAIMEVYRSTDLGVQTKGDDSPLTRADLAADAVILDGLGSLTPDVPILSEESGTVAFEVRRAWDTFWLVDPLDGTKEFIHRRDEFTVNVALVAAGKPVWGVVHAPAIDETFVGGPDGAVRGADGRSDRIQVASPPEGRPWRVVASRSHRNAPTNELLARLPDHELVPGGSSLKFCRVAEGKADIYPRLAPTMEWDTGAAQAVLEAAGGRVVDLAGAPLSYNKPELLNPHFIATGSIDPRPFL